MSCDSNSFLSAEDTKNLSTDWKIIFREICAIQQAILDAAASHSYETLVSGSSPITSTGGIHSVSVLSKGTGYLDTDTVVATDAAGTGQNASFELGLNSCGEIEAVTVLTPGSTYSAVTSLSVTTSTGTGAILVPHIGPTLVDATKYWAVWDEQVTDRQIQYQLEFITKYFQDLGYNIDIQTNPSTLNTIQWFISW